jgi:tetratricopeptide (TPR) repeat protein
MLLAAGDTAGAGSIAERVAGTADPGPARRRAVRLLFELRLEGDPDAAEDLLDRYLEEPGVDGELAGAMAAALARARARRGELEEAEAALERADGLVPDDSTFARLELQRGWLRLMQGRPGAALSALEAGAAVPSGDPTARAEALLFADALGRADSVRATELGAGLRALVADGDAGPLSRAADAWLEEPEAASDAGPALVGLAAAALERSGRSKSAGGLRSRLVEAWPDAPEAPFALLELGRSAAPGDPVRAREWLRRLVVEYPESPAAPLARRILGELEGSVPAAGAEAGP